MSATEWIKCDDEMPQTGEMVAAWREGWTRTRPMCVRCVKNLRTNYRGTLWFSGNFAAKKDNLPTHWTHFPPAPSIEVSA